MYYNSCNKSQNLDSFYLKNLIESGGKWSSPLYAFTAATIVNIKFKIAMIGNKIKPIMINIAIEATMSQII